MARSLLSPGHCRISLNVKWLEEAVLEGEKYRLIFENSPLSDCST
ncbi:MAG: hypothetical protein R2741_14655 [Methanolobus sp.]